MGDGRAEGSSAIVDRRQGAISLTPDDGMHIRIFESSQLVGPYVGDLLYYYFIILGFFSCLTQCQVKITKSPLGFVEIRDYGSVKSTFSLPQGCSPLSPQLNMARVLIQFPP